MKPALQCEQVRLVFRLISKRPGKLQQQSAEAPSFQEWPDAAFEFPFVLGSCIALVGERPEQLCGEAEPAILGHPLGPALCGIWLRRAVKRRVDLDRVEILGKVTNRIEALRLL